MEYCDKGDLFQKITYHKKNETLFEEREIWNTLIQILFGLKELHVRNIYHRDLKSANIFLARGGNVKIGDMNVSKLAKNGLLYTQTGTPYYASPEVWKDEPYDLKSDMWSLGCIIYEMATLKPPFRAESMEGLFKKVTKGTFDRLPSRYSKELSDVVKMMLKVNPNQRANCDEILSLPGILDHLESHLNIVCDENQDQSVFLSTIKIPKNPFRISECMPKPNYIPLKIRNASQTVQVNKVSHSSNSMPPVKKIFMSVNLPNQSKEAKNEFINVIKKQRQHLPFLNNKNNANNKNSLEVIHEKIPSINNSITPESSRLDYFNNCLLQSKNSSQKIMQMPKLPIINKNISPYRQKQKVYKNVRLEPIRY